MMTLAGGKTLMKGRTLLITHLVVRKQYDDWAALAVIVLRQTRDRSDDSLSEQTLHSFYAKDASNLDQSIQKGACSEIPAKELSQMWKLFLLSMATAALMAGSVAAITLSSEIKAIDAKFRIAILSNGQTYQLAANIDANKFKPGDKVTINYEQIGTKSIISKIEKAK